MSWLGRLLGRTPAPTAAVPATTVVVPDDLAAVLTADGSALSQAVETALREAVETRRRVAARPPGERIPFWLERDSGRPEGIEDELRDRMAQRKAVEEAAPVDDVPTRRRHRDTTRAGDGTPE